MSVVSQKQFQKGDLVTPDASNSRVPRQTVGCVFRVTAVPGGSRKNYRAEAVSPPGVRGINFPGDMLLSAANGEADRQKNVFPTVTPQPLPDIFNPGEVVTLKKAWKSITTETPLVVLRQGEKRVSVARLGGESASYVAVSPSGLVRRQLVSTDLVS